MIAGVSLQVIKTLEFRASAGAEVIFLASAVQGPDGRVAGALVFQLDTEILHSSISDPQGLGETGEVHLLGADGKTRTPSHLAGGLAAFSPAPATGQRDADERSTMTALFREFLATEDIAGVAESLGRSQARRVVFRPSTGPARMLVVPSAMSPRAEPAKPPPKPAATSWIDLF